MFKQVISLSSLALIISLSTTSNASDLEGLEPLFNLGYDELQQERQQVMPTDQLIPENGPSSQASPEGRFVWDPERFLYVPVVKQEVLPDQTTIQYEQSNQPDPLVMNNVEGLIKGGYFDYKYIQTIVYKGAGNHICQTTGLVVKLDHASQLEFASHVLRSQINKEIGTKRAAWIIKRAQFYGNHYPAPEPFEIGGLLLQLKSVVFSDLPADELDKDDACLCYANFAMKFMSADPSVLQGCWPILDTYAGNKPHIADIYRVKLMRDYKCYPLGLQKPVDLYKDFHEELRSLKKPKTDDNKE